MSELESQIRQLLDRNFKLESLNTKLVVALEMCWQRLDPKAAPFTIDIQALLKEARGERR